MRFSEINALVNEMHRSHATVLTDDKMRISVALPKNAGTANISGGFIAGRNIFLGANTYGHGHVVQTGGTLAASQKFVIAEDGPGVGGGGAGVPVLGEKLRRTIEELLAALRGGKSAHACSAKGTG